MSTFGVMKQRISDEMKRGDLSLSSTAVQSSILSAIAHLERRRFWFNELTETVVSASSSATYVSLPATLLMVDSVRVTVGSRDYALSERPWGWINDVDSGQYYGYPDYFALKADQMRLYPPPNQDMPLTISGIQKLTEVSAAATADATNAWMTDGEELVRLIAKGMLFRDEVRNPQMAEYYRSEGERMMRELNRQTTNKASGRIRPRYL